MSKRYSKQRTAAARSRKLDRVHKPHRAHGSGELRAVLDDGLKTGVSEVDVEKIRLKQTQSYHAKRAAKPTLPKMPWEQK